MVEVPASSLPTHNFKKKNSIVKLGVKQNAFSGYLTYILGD